MENQAVYSPREKLLMKAVAVGLTQKLRDRLQPLLSEPAEGSSGLIQKLAEDSGKLFDSIVAESTLVEAVPEVKQQLQSASLPDQAAETAELARPVSALEAHCLNVDPQKVPVPAALQYLLQKVQGTAETETGAYTGELVSGVPSGAGKEVDPFGNTFTGHFLNGLKHGSGTYSYAATGRIDEGFWSYGKEDGIMKVSRPEEDPVYRVYRDGEMLDVSDWKWS